MAGLPKIDWANVIRGVWDSDNQAIRTTMQAIVATGSMEVSIDAAQDSIRLGDGTLLNTLTNSGGKNGVDVNVIAPVTVNGVVGVSGTTAVSGSLGRTWTLDSSTDSISAAQLGIWNINSITGTVSLPTNAAQEASGHLEAIDNKLNSLGQKAMTGSVPVVIASDQSTVSISGLVSADQSGVWNINNVSGIISLPTNAAQEASGHLEFIDAKLNSLGQKTSTGSVPVVIASDQSTVSISGLVSAEQSGIWNINNVSGVISLPTGAATEATLAKLTQTQGSATTGQSGPLVQGAVSTAPPTYITDTTDPLSLTVSGSLRSDLSSIAGSLVDTGNGIAGIGVQRVVVASDNDAFAVSALQNGTWTVQQGTPPWQVVGNVSSASADSGNPVKIGAIYNSDLPTFATGQRTDAQADVNGKLITRANLYDGSNNALTSHITSNLRGLDVGIVDGPQIDSYNRLRTANQTLIFGVTFANTVNTLLFNTAITGGATLTSVTNQAAARLSATTGATDSVIAQSKRYIRYNPGVSHQVMITGIIGAKKTNVRQRWGYFDDQDGLFFEQTSTDLAVVTRSSTSGSPVDTRILQANWNLDKLDGTGNSGVSLDTTKHNVYVIDFVWQGAGRTRFGIMSGQGIIYFHQISNANINTAPYMRSPSRPIRTELVNLGATASSTNMDIVCVLALRETSDALLPPFNASASRGATSVNVSTIKPLISVRPKSTFNSITNRVPIFPASTTVITSNQNILIQIYINATLTGASFTSAGTNSAAEFDVTATAVSGGTLVLQTYLNSSNTSGQLDLLKLADTIILGLDIAGSVQDTITITATSLAGGTTTWSSINWQEFQ